MNDNLRAQIHSRLSLKNTDELLEIWQTGDTSAWKQDVFEIVQEILLQRLGYVPPQSNDAQARRILENVEKHIDNDELEKALSECEVAIQLNPDSAIAHNYRGEIYEQMGQLEYAISSYQRAIHLDPELGLAWENMLAVQTELEKEFARSLPKQHLDRALEYAENEKPELAMQECEMAKSVMPSIAIAYNYLGMVLQTLDQLELAIDSYLKAIELNPRFFPARENLANARVRWEEEQYLQMTNRVPNEDDDERVLATEDEGSLDSEIAENGIPVPGWVYLDANAFLLIGWPGYRNRPGRSGYDPLERDFEYAHMQGVIFRKLITRKFRTRSPIYLVLMTCVGILYLLYGAVPFTLGNGMGILTGLISSPYFVIGITLLINVYLSLRLEKAGEDEDNGDTFF